MFLYTKNIKNFIAKYFIAIIYILIFITFTNYVFAKTVTLENVLVTKIIDGDTIWVKIKNKSEKIRLLGINAPEISTIPPEFFGEEATIALTKILTNKTIIITYDDKYMRDKYKRILANIYLKQPDNNLLSVTNYMVEKGFAIVYIIQDTPIVNLQELIKSENYAIENRIGLWQLESNLPITPNLTNNYIDSYKIVTGTILSIYDSKKSIWLQMENNKQQGFSIRIDKSILPTIQNYYNVKALIGKQIMIRGFINKYSPKFGAFIDLKNPLALYVIE